jgi:hypothetical protein
MSIEKKSLTNQSPANKAVNAKRKASVTKPGGVVPKLS